MKEILYLDVYFLINGVMDLVSLMLAGLIASERGRGWRLVTAALFGSGASLVLLVISPPPFLTLLFGFLTFPVMILIAYGLRSVKRLFFISLFAFLSALFLGGALESVSYYTHRSGNATLFVFLAVILFAFGAFVIWGKGLRRKMESSVISLSIVHREKEAQLFGLLDSGSFLKEPTSGAPVILLKAEY
ncbi:MAG: sigma-E processing peptidase SpoIIGA, partial [Clostridia bacterium]|nr:sigma-E processing peptidase SpoIIGA [Clostridia bacterium]